MKLPGWLNLNTISAAIIVGACLYIGVLKYQLMSCRLDAKDNQAELDRISTNENEQRQTTERTIKGAERLNREADRQAERIENAPTAPGCETPGEILGADL